MSDAIHRQERSQRGNQYAHTKHQGYLQHAEAQQRDVDTGASHIIVQNSDCRQRRGTCQKEVDKGDHECLAEEDLEHVGGSCTHGTQDTDLALLIRNRGRDEVHQEEGGEHGKAETHPNEHLCQYLNDLIEVAERVHYGILHLKKQLGIKVLGFCVRKLYQLLNGIGIVCGDRRYHKGPNAAFMLGNILGVAFDVKTNGTDKKFTVALPGEINAHNSLIALAIGDIFGVSDEESAEGLRQVFVKGRCEIMKDTDDITVIIDYAHNGVSLKSIIDTARAYDHNRVITLFGSVGGRTECRREELGTVSGKMSDFTVITSDDPDFEDPASICEEIASYCKAAGGEYVIYPDRSEAVNYAVKMAVSGDILILAGKGHEEYMKIKGEKVPFNEREEVIKAFREKKEGK